MLYCQNAGTCCLNVAISVFSPPQIWRIWAIFPKENLWSIHKPQKKKKKKNQCEFAKKKTLLLAIETLQNHFIFEFLVLKFSFWRRFTSEKNGWFLGQVKQEKRQRRYF